MKGFSLTNEKGAWLNVTAVHFISPSRCECRGANCAVVIGEITVGSFKPGDKVVIKDKSNRDLLDDIVARLEIGCEKRDEVKIGDHVGMLLMNNTPGALLQHGIPRYKAHVPPTARPYHS